MRKIVYLLVLMACAALPAMSAETQKPGHVPRKSPELSPLLAPGAQTNAQAAWEEQRKELREKWLNALGGLPKEKPPLNARTIGKEDLADFTREHIQYEVEPGIGTDGYLLTPKGLKGKLPGLVVFHATTEFGPRGPAGLETAYPEEKWQGVHFVRNGYIVWCPRNFINTPGADYAGNAVKLLSQRPGWTGMGRMTWDAIRAADFLESCPRVDPKRIGCFGHSLGAKEVLYAMALEERYRAGVFSEGGMGLDFSNWDAPWYLGQKIHAPGFGLEHHQLLALIAPRPLLLIAGDSADDQRSGMFVSAARPVYEIYGAGKNLRFYNHHQGHVYTPEIRATAEEFLNRRLKEPQ